MPAFWRYLVTLPVTAVLGTALADTQSTPRRAYFERIATLPVYETLEPGSNRKTETSAEIIAASADGRTLMFTDSPGGALVFLDATDPADLRPGGRVLPGGEPTSVAVAGTHALVSTNTSRSHKRPSGHLAVVNIASRSVAAACDVQGQPDHVAVSPDGSFAAVAVENQRDEKLSDGFIPQLPPGHLAVFELDARGMPSNCSSARIVVLTGLAQVAPTDPEPEYVAINERNIAVVTLQENNHLALVELASGKIVKHFSAGSSSAAAIPTRKARRVDGTGSIQAVAREPDGVAWIDNDRFITANEGDYVGGSRGFTIWRTSGEVQFDSGARIEHLAMRHGHYPAKRAHKRGTEPESVTVGTFGNERLLFVNAERANFVAVYRDTGAAPEFLQFLPTHVKPEGLMADPDRGLFFVANEEDDAKDGVRAALSVYRYGSTKPRYPTIVSQEDPTLGAPIGWGALSGLTADVENPNFVYAVSDGFYDSARIYRIDVSRHPARIVSYVDLKGGSAKRYDLEGIAVRQAGGFWLVSEGRPKKDLQNLLLQVTVDGTIEREFRLPEALTSHAKRSGFEGVAEYQQDGVSRVVIAIQREWRDDPRGMTKLAIFTPAEDRWGFVRYPLDAPRSPAGGWVGLSGITWLGGVKFAVLERDNKGGKHAAIKQITTISLEGISPASLRGELPVLEKHLALDLLPALSANNGLTLEKVEGLAITADGRLLAVTDNDGVDDATGETLLLDLGPISRLQ